MKSCAIARLPIVHARCSGVLRSLVETVLFTTSESECARTTMMDFISDRHTASTSCGPKGILGLMVGKNSLVSYFALIHRSFSSLLEFGFGFVREYVFASHTEFAKVFPIASITLRWPGLKKKEKC